MLGRRIKLNTKLAENQHSLPSSCNQPFLFFLSPPWLQPLPPSSPLLFCHLHCEQTTPSFSSQLVFSISSSIPTNNHSLGLISLSFHHRHSSLSFPSTSPPLVTEKQHQKHTDPPQQYLPSSATPTAPAVSFSFSSVGPVFSFLQRRPEPATGSSSTKLSINAAPASRHPPRQRLFLPRQATSSSPLRLFFIVVAAACRIQHAAWLISMVAGLGQQPCGLGPDHLGSGLA
ncbi:hypothetical protein D5086_014161 [Populus alba]|uniref:Uncharacterized protein n=1 Tax=Populus alba TaxID=43335 RepID=A0ACC4C9Q5_POPAL